MLKLTTTQAAHRLGVSPQTVRNYASTGLLAFEFTPYGRLFREDDVDRLKQARDLGSEARGRRHQAAP